MERYLGRDLEKGKKDAHKNHSTLQEISQVIELRDRFGITNPKLLAKALRISEFKAMDIFQDMESDSKTER